MNDKNESNIALPVFLTKIIDFISARFENKRGNSLLICVSLYIGKGLLIALYSFLISSSPLLFSAYPLGIALLGAMSENVIFVFAGCVISSIILKNGLNIAFFLTYTFLLIARFVISKWLTQPDTKPFCEGITMRCIVSLIASFAISLYRCFIESFSLFTLGALVFTIFVSFAMTFVFSGFYEKERGFRNVVAKGALLFCLVLAAEKYGFFGYSLGFAVSSAVCVYVSYKYELLYATVISLVCGLACGEPVLSPMFALIALSHGIVLKYNKNIALPVSLLIGTAYAFWIYKASALTYIMPDLIFGSLIILPIKYFTEKGKEKEKAKDGEENTATNDDIYYEYRIKKEAELISENMYSLSGILDNLSDKLRAPNYSDISSLCKNVCDESCSNCVAKKKCYAGLDYEESEIRKKMASYLYESGYLTSSELPQSFSNTCKKADDILASLNLEYGKILKERMCEDRTKAFACGYACVSKLISESIQKAGEEHTVDEKLTEKAVKAIKDAGIKFEKAYITGSRKKTLTVKGMADAAVKLSGGKLRNVFSEICACPMSAPYIEYALSKWQMKCESEPLIACRCSIATRTIDGEDVCGDTVHSFSSDDGFFYTVLSDGMGSGRQAALVSRICCTFAEKLSLSGGTPKTVIETINNYILSQSYECCATMDLLKIDLYTSKAYFVKSGAASSMIIRDGHIFKIDSASVPVGALREINSEQITFPVEVGDYIVMSSDGVSPDMESGMRAAQTVIENPSLPLEALSECIIKTACEGGKRRDDMSVAVIKIDKMYNR